MTKSQRILNLILLPILIFIAFFIVKFMIQSKPETIIVKPKIIVPSVAYIESSPQSITPTITTYGNIHSFFEARISAQVSGEVESVAPAFNSGRTVRKGELLVQIDPADYLVIISQQKALLASAQQVLSEERIRSQLAVQEWIESGRSLESATSFTLRKPQLEAAEARLASAKASLEKAKLDLKRTQIKAPFDAIVQNRSTSPGNVVNSGTILGVLIAKERAEVRLPLTPTQIQRLDLPMNGASETEIKAIAATLTTPTQPNAYWRATITRTEPSINQQNQVIYIVGEIEKPFDNPNAFLPIGAFVNASISAKRIENAYRIPNTALVEDAFVWVITPENTLQKVAVTRIIPDRDSLVIRFDNEPAELTHKVAIRPLASFRSDQTVKPVFQGKK